MSSHLYWCPLQPLRAKGWDKALVEYIAAMLTDSSPYSKPLVNRFNEISCPGNNSFVAHFCYHLNENKGNHILKTLILSGKELMYPEKLIRKVPHKLSRFRLGAWYY